MAITLTKGYTNTTATATHTQYNNAYDLQVATNYVKRDPQTAEQRSKNKAGDAREMIYENITGDDDKKEFIYFRFNDKLTGVNYDGVINDYAQSRLPKKKHALTKQIILSSQGWDIVTDPDDSAFVSYTDGWLAKLIYIWDSDSLIPASQHLERVERLASLMGYDDDKKSRLLGMLKGIFVVED